MREAYFVGRDVDNRQAFFDQYVHFPKGAERGPDVHLIEFRTPYEQVARRSQERWANYDVLDAEEEYAHHPNEVTVRVLLCGTMTFDSVEKVRKKRIRELPAPDLPVPF